MKETEKRISEYRKALPRLKEKVLAAALMLVVSVVTMTASTFAWLTISRKPEVSGVATTISGNGNLEIALSDFDGLEPEESEVGDSGKNIIAKNVTWGNLVNLSNSQYGLQNLTLRPATLNQNALSTNPLRAAVYGADGRVTTTTSDFAFTIFDGIGAFKVPTATQYGVKAISSVGYEYPGGQSIRDIRIEKAYSKLNDAQGSYQQLCSTANMQSISGVIGDYVTCMMNDKLNKPATPQDSQLYKKDFRTHMSNLNVLIGKLCEMYDSAATAVLAIWNLQMPLDALDLNLSAIMLTEEDIAAMDAIVDAREAATAESEEVVFTSADTKALFKVVDDHLADLKAQYGIEVKGFRQFLHDYYFAYRYKAEIGAIAAVASSQPVYWRDFSHIANYVVDIPTTKVEGTQVNALTKDAAMDMLDAEGNLRVDVQKGILWNMEQFLGQEVAIEGVSVKVTLIFTVNKKGDIYTTVNHDTYILPALLKELETGGGSVSSKVAFAQDTYGMAIDLWLRTNMENCYLTLEGNVLTETYHKTDNQGNLYYKDSAGTEYYQAKDGKYYDINGKEAEELDTDSLTKVMETKVIGFEGENRIWDKDAYRLTDNSLTQGTGSCYVFYADSPTEQAQGLELMKALKVAFIDDEGTLLAIADMDSDSHYAEGGRVTVPLKLKTNSMVAGEDEDGNTIYAITKLDRGISTRLTAIIYMDGYQLENSQVLNKESIQGQLNIQFGTSTEMEPVVDEDLMAKELTVTAEITPNSFEFVADTVNESKVKLTIAGYTPTEVKASFVRQINSSQGTKQDELTFTGSGASWEADAKFKAPGTYILRTVWLDGVEYMLKEPQTVEITGYSLTSLRVEGITDKVTTIRTADSAYTKNIYVEFAGDSGLTPKKVQVLFMNEANQSVLVDCFNNTVDWEGKITFPTSGTYHMDYYLIDGEYYELPENLKKTFIVQLGLKVQVFISPNAVFEYDYDEEAANAVDVDVWITDNNGTQMTGLEDVELYYKNAATGALNPWTPLKWNEATGFYEGAFQIENVGAYNFYALDMEGSYITSGEAPTIRALPPDPPSYVEYVDRDNENVFSISQDVGMTVAVDYSSAAKITAVMTKEGTSWTKKVEGRILTAEEGGAAGVTSNWYFAIPKDGELDETGLAMTHEGTWKITQLLVSEAYFNGIYVGAGAEKEYVTWDMSAENIWMNVSSEIGIDIVTTTDSNQIAKTYTGEFLVQQKTSAGDLKLNVYGVVNGKKQPLDGTATITVGYGLDYDAYTDTSGKQYYVIGTDATSEDVLNGVLVEGKLSLTDEVSDATTGHKYTYAITDANALKMDYAGTYYCKYIIVDVTAGGNTKKYVIGSKSDYSTNNYDKWYEDESSLAKITAMPKYEVGWTAPVVKFKSMTLNRSVRVNKGNALNATTNDYVTNGITNNNFTCTAHMELTSYESYLWGRLYRVTAMEAPKVTTEISGAGNFTSAKLSFIGSQTNAVYEYTKSNPTPEVQVGSFNWAFDRFVMGTVTEDELDIYGSIGADSVKYIFTLENQLTLINSY